ncbi:prepilin-type N-terminal cleavage/methylation domain-containing protein [Desulfobacterales bacterium HSG17]|nr:prepilin-type N-terminal cleavage/methylation domain-containing protein [Desulfobacterales bacterium HSG17]
MNTIHALLGKKINNPDGFSLMEIMIALAIFSIGILAVISMQVSAIQGNGTGRVVTESVTSLQDQIETIISIDYDNALLDDSDNDGVGGLDDATSGTADQFQAATSDNPYELYYNVANDYPIENTKTLRIIVIWNNRGVDTDLSLDYIRGIT